MEEKDLGNKLPDEPSYKDRVRRSREERKKIHDEEFAKLPKGLREIANLADELTEYHRFNE